MTASDWPTVPVMVPGSGGITGAVVVNVVQWRQPWSGAQPASESSRMTAQRFC